MNILIIGHRQHGKTDVGAMLAKALSTTAHDSSWYMCKNVIYPALKEKYGYDSAAACHADRGNHRQEWFELIEAYNDEPDRLTKAILSEGSIYVGMRSRMEFEGSKHHFDAVVWVDASQRAPLEPSTSMKLTQADADYVFDNNGPIEDLPLQLSGLLIWLSKRWPKSENPMLVYGSGPTGIQILTQIIAGDESQISKQMGDLYGPGSDEPMSPMRTLQAASREDASNDAETVNEQVGKITLSQYSASEGIVSLASDEGFQIAVADTSYWMRSMGILQERASEWAETQFGATDLQHKLDRVWEEMQEILNQPNDVVEWSDALMIFLHAAQTQGIHVDEIMNAGFEKLEVLKRRKYTYDPFAETWSYVPAEGYAQEDTHLTITK